MNRTTSTPRVLVIDDHDSLRRNIVALLEDEGFDVLEAGSGEAALTLLDDRTVDVAVVDMRLPGISGLEFIERSARKCQTLRFIVHTGSTDFVLPSNARQLRLKQCDIFLKPIEDIHAFLDHIRSLCQESLT